MDVEQPALELIATFHQSIARAQGAWREYASFMTAAKPPPPKGSTDICLDRPRRAFHASAKHPPSLSLVAVSPTIAAPGDVRQANARPNQRTDHGDAPSP
jgi:hypothetical protein